MSYATIARRYARAIYELGHETGKTATLQRELGELGEVYDKNIELQLALKNPLVAASAKQSLLQDICNQMSLSDTTKSTVLLLLNKRRIEALPEIAKGLATLADDASGVVRALVKSAVPLSQEYLNKLQSELEKSTGKKVSILHQVDPSLLAGIVTQIGDQVIDGSVRTKLSSFKDALGQN